MATDVMFKTTFKIKMSFTKVLVHAGKAGLVCSSRANGLIAWLKELSRSHQRMLGCMHQTSLICAALLINCASLPTE